MSESVLIAKNARTECLLLLGKANRHGLITGATGTGKTVTLHAMAEAFSRKGVPVFLADVKGDLAGISEPGSVGGKMAENLQRRGIAVPAPFAAPTVFWDLFARQGHAVRTTISNMGPLLLSRMLNLNAVQSGVLSVAFRVADDDGLLLLDLKDLRAVLHYLGAHAKEYSSKYGNISTASVGAIQRALLQLEEQGGEQFFGEPMLDITDFMQCDGQGHGQVNVLAAGQLMNAPRLYSAFLLWLLSDLFEMLPEVGDPERPKLVFFFDEAHLLFKDAPKVLLERIELVVRLIRSKGVGVYFVTQSPADIPDSVLGQLGNRVQHALRAFTQRDQKAVRATAQTMRPNPELDIERAITELGVGEALVSLLDEKGSPGMTERAFVVPPGSLIGPIDEARRQQHMQASRMADKYDQAVDNESAYELLQQREAQQLQADAAPAAQQERGLMGGLSDFLFGSTGPRGGRKDGLLQSTIKSTVRTETNRMGRQLLRGVLGSLTGGRRRR